jgi:hypothetical protein
MRLTDNVKITRIKRLSCEEALRSLVNYLEADPDLYDGDDDGALGRVMYSAKLALKMRHCQNAAPELLEALQEIITAADGEGWSQLDAGFTKARAAVAKALGND